MFSLLSVYSLQAQWTSDSMLNTTVRDSIGTEEATPLIATTSSGNTYVSFFEMYNGSYELRMQLLDANGNKLWPEEGLIVSDFPQSSALFRYDLTVDNNDNAVVAFQDTRSGDLQVVAYKLDEDANFLWGANGIELIDPLATGGLAPTIGITAANNAIIGWNADDGSKKWVAFTKIDEEGNFLWDNTRRVIDSVSTAKYSRPTFVPSGDDDFTMLYVEETGFGLGVSNLYAQQYDAMGAAIWTAPVHVSTYTIPFFYFPKAISDMNGGFYLSFNTSNVNFPTETDVYVQHVNSSGDLWNNTGNVACTLSNSQHFSADAAFDNVNNSFWVLMNVTDINQSTMGAYVQKFDSSGNVGLTSNGAELVANDADYNNPGAMSVTSDGVIAMYSIGSFIETLNAVKCDFDGALMWGGDPVVLCSNASSKLNPSAGLFLNDQVVFVWADERFDKGVYAQNISNSGVLGTSSNTIAEVENKSAVFAYPNPFNDQVTVSFNDYEAGDLLEVYDLMGNKIYSTLITSDLVTLNTAEWAKGYYFLSSSDIHLKIIKH